MHTNKVMFKHSKDKVNHINKNMFSSYNIRLGQGFDGFHETHDQKQLWEENVYFSLHAPVTIHHEGKSRPEFKVGT